MKPQQLITELTGATDATVADLQSRVTGVALSRINPVADGGNDCDSPAYEQCLIDHAGELGTCICPSGDFKKAG